MQLPSGHAHKLNKSLYGLKQSPRCWYNTLKLFFLSIDFEPAPSDPCLFTLKNSTALTFIFVHVDDLIIGGSAVPETKEKIRRQFDMEDLGECAWILGMRVSRDRSKKVISLHQDQYVTNILKEFNMTDAKGARTPLPANCTSSSNNSRPIDPDFNYQRAVGLLNYLVQCTRPDLA